MLRTILAVTALAVFAVVIGLPLLLLAWITRRIGPFYPAAAVGLRIALAIAGVRIVMEGEENIPAGACLFMANHTSAVDPVAVFVAVPRRIGFLAKQELFRMPLIGWAMQLAGFIPVDRSSREGAAASADVAVEQLRSGASMVIYPEGTRSPDGKLLPFKRGGFLMAIRGGRPIVPMTIAGAERVLPKGETWIRPGEIRLQFHPAVDVSAYREDDREKLLVRVREVIASGLATEFRATAF
ncbi:MAG: 1-acyl-sn-glycerol-3-phosphate acyltransferase [Acidobacteriota bacterium]|nr:1-acyl-sn-glycerol-3-phosphate acyltransferase [Acidobacteriota bacterium]